MSTSRFAKLLKQLRMTAGEGGTELSYRELAARSGYKLSHQYLWKIERGDSPPPRDVEKIRALATGLGNTTYEELLEAAGYLRQAGPSSDIEIATVLSRKGLSERGIAEVEAFYKFVLQREAAASRAKRTHRAK